MEDKIFGKFLIGAAALALWSSAVSVAPAAITSANEVMWFADSYTSAYYALGQHSHEVVIRVADFR